MKLDELNKNSIAEMSSIELEEFIEKNELTEKQQLEIYKIYNRERKANVKNILKKEGVKSIKEGVVYVHAFTQNLRKIEDNLSGAEFKIIIYLCEIMQHGNILVGFSQKKLAEDLGMSTSNVSKCLKKLKEKGILVEDQGHTYINSNLFLKGQYHSLNKERRGYVKSAQSENTIFDSVYNLKTVSSKNEEKERKEKEREELEEINFGEELSKIDDEGKAKIESELFPDPVPF